MRVWTSSDFFGHYPVGSAAVVVAPDEATALRLLSEELTSRGLRSSGTLVELDLSTPKAVVLVDGDY